MQAMKTLYYGAKVFLNGEFQPMDVLVDAFSNLYFEKSTALSHSSFDKLIDCTDFYIIPGLADVHVHLREPGFSCKETIKSGTAAAAKGGYTVLCAMPNVSPPPDSLENLQQMLDIIEKDARIKVLPLGTITKGQKGGELSDMREMSPFVAGFSDDGIGVQNDEIMRLAMRAARELSLPIVAHCEDESLIDKGGCIHKGEYAKEYGFVGISSESEWVQVERDIALVRKTLCPYHVCHISTKETVDLIRQAKKEGLPVTCETAPHYLVFSDEDLKDEGRFKMNPPIRSKADRAALIEGLVDGTIDIIATDHAPHTAEEKSKGLAGSMFGIVGLETAFPVLYTKLVKTGILSLETLIHRMAVRPRELFKLNNPYEHGQEANFTVLDLSKKYTINPDDFLSKGRANPFDGLEVYGETVMTVCEGKIAYERENV